MHSTTGLPTVPPAALQAEPGRRSLPGSPIGARLGLGTKEVLGFMIVLDFKDLLGSPILLLGSPRLS